LSYSTSYAYIRGLAQRAAIAGTARISPHSLRHSFATQLVANGVPLQDVQNAMGHADLCITRAYGRTRHRGDRHSTHAMAARLRRSRTTPSDVL
jgi:integrase/recombinase XerD